MCQYSISSSAPPASEDMARLLVVCARLTNCLGILPRQCQDIVPISGPVSGSLSPRSREQAPAPAASEELSLWGGILLWAVPKRRTSHSKKRMRMAHKYLKPKTHYQTCPKCGNLKLQHMLCAHCFRETMRLTAQFRREQAAGRAARETETSAESSAVLDRGS